MKNRAFTLMELLVVVAICMATLIVLTPFVQIAKARARKINCANNLRHISLGLHSYAADHNGAFPQTLGELYPNYVEDQKSFDCPASKSVGSPAGPDYIYVQSLTENAPP
ncbi:MAG: type II secretion system protein, partial [Candidatus Omnitrophica bacterium]|nr:type II secretion system protein [Candidatus Omnitrophota bacterium]